MNPQHIAIAAAIAHVEGFFSVRTLAHMNHNPGNIESSSGQFMKYPDIGTGWVALIKDVAANHGYTLRTFLHKYAPIGENDTVMYVNVVSSLSGVGPEELIEPATP